MIDLKKYRENPEIYVKWAADKQVRIDWDLFNELDQKVREKKWELDLKNEQRNIFSAKIQETMKSWGNAIDLIEKVKLIKSTIEQIEKEYAELYSQFNDIYLRIPNPSHESVIIGKDDSENSPICFVWEKPTFDFEPLPHYELLEKRWMLDQERSWKVSGSRFYYIRDGLVKLEFALIQFAIDKLSKKWFRPTIVPNLVREDAMIATGFFPADKNEIYHVNPGEDDLYLIWTSEVALVAQHMDETIDVNDLPLRYVGFSPCYRREAWSYGKDTKGMIRVHQFEKIEMVSFVKPDDSWKEHELIVSIEEEIFQELWLPYQKINICTWDLGAPAAKKYDLEAWFPTQNAYREVTSCSNCTDFQARRAKIKYKNWEEKEFLHTLNGTAISMARALACIVENYQTKDLRVKVPTVLKKYMDEDYI